MWVLFFVITLKKSTGMLFTHSRCLAVFLSLQKNGRWGDAA